MSDNTVRVRVSGPQFRYDYEWYEQEDELEVSEETLEEYPRRLERVDDVQEESAEADEEDGLTIDDLDPHPDDRTISELEERVADVDDVELLETILEAEQEDDPRTGAVDAVQDRLDELEG